MFNYPPPFELPNAWPEDPPGWYDDPRDTNAMLWWNGYDWKDTRPLPPPESGTVHFLLFLLTIAGFVGLNFIFLAGYFVLPFALRTTGRRARDFFMLLIPIWNVILLTQTLWRLSAQRICWLPRQDLASKPLFGPAVLPKTQLPNWR